MSLNSIKSGKRRNLSIWVLLLINIIVISIILSLLIDPIWWILLPIAILLIITFQMTSHYFWLEKKTCPRCNAPITKYGDYCKNCGIKLWYRCLSCGKYIRTSSKFCENCNTELEHTEEEREVFDYEILKEGSKIPLKPNFCPNCGAKINSDGNIEICEECGEKI